MMSLQHFHQITSTLPSDHCNTTTHQLTPTLPSAHSNTNYHQLTATLPSDHCNTTIRSLQNYHTSAHSNTTYHQLTAKLSSAHCIIAAVIHCHQNVSRWSYKVLLISLLHIAITCDDNNDSSNDGD